MVHPPDAKVLARPDAGSSGIGRMRNRWDGGRSVYLSEAIIPTVGNGRERVLDAVRELAPKPIPAVSACGLTNTSALVATPKCLFLRRRSRLTVC